MPQTSRLWLTVCYMPICVTPNAMEVKHCLGFVSLSLVIRPHLRGQTIMCLVKCCKVPAKCTVTTKALTSTMTVLNKPIDYNPCLCYFLIPSKWPHMHVVHRIVYYKRLYINFSINILYVQMKGRQRYQYFYLWNWARMFFTKANGQNIKALAAVSLNRKWWPVHLEVKN